MNSTFDVIIVGGSYAGLSAAMALGRSLRKVLIIDSGKPCNIQTPQSHNFLTQDGVAPNDIATISRNQVANYDTVQFYSGSAESALEISDGFEIKTQNQDIFHGKKLVIATGIRDLLPNINGFSSCWGISVIHCPYCHGYEFHGQNTGIMSNGETAIHLASLVNNLTKQLAILTNGESQFSPEQLEKLEKNRIRIIDQPIVEIVHEQGNLKCVVFENNESLSLDALYASVPFTQSSDIPVSIGCELEESGHIKVDQFQRTTVNGVYACGDNTSPFRSVANAVAAGNIVGAVANKDLVEDQF